MKRRRYVLALVIGVAGLGGILLPSAHAGAVPSAGSAPLLAADSPPPLPRGAIDLGSLPAQTAVRVVVTLRVRELSPTKITVTAPRGSGTVTVTVSAAGGTSAATPSDRYRYQ